MSNNIECKSLSEVREDLVQRIAVDSGSGRELLLKYLANETYNNHMRLTGTMVWMIGYVLGEVSGDMIPDYPVMYRAKVLGWSSNEISEHPTWCYVKPMSGIVATEPLNGFYTNRSGAPTSTQRENVEALGADIRTNTLIPCHADDKLIELYKERVRELGGVVVDKTLRGKARLAVRDSTVTHNSRGMMQYLNTDTTVARKCTELWPDRVGTSTMRISDFFQPRNVLCYGTVAKPSAFKKHIDARTRSESVSSLRPSLTESTRAMLPFVDTTTKESAMLVRFLKDNKAMQMKVGKFFAQYTDADNEQVKSWVTQHKQYFLPPTIQYAATVDEICEVYAEGPSSCMSYDMDEYRTDIRPVAAYGDSDLQVAYIEVRGRITARTVCSVENKEYIRVYGDDLLASMLNEEGYTHIDSLEGYRLRAIKDEDYSSRYVGPYLDGEVRRGNLSSDNEWFTIEDNGEYVFENTNGHIDHSPNYDNSCDRCGAEGNTEDMRSVYDDSACDTESIYCDSCHEYHTESVTNELGNSVTIRGGWSLTAYDDVLFTSATAAENAGYRYFDDVGGWAHADKGITDALDTDTTIHEDTAFSVTGLDGSDMSTCSSSLEENTEQLLVRPYDFTEIFILDDGMDVSEAVESLGFEVVPIRDMMQRVANITVGYFMDTIDEGGVLVRRNKYEQGLSGRTSRMALEDIRKMMFVELPQQYSGYASCLEGLFSRAHNNAVMALPPLPVDNLDDLFVGPLPQAVPATLVKGDINVWWDEAAGISEVAYNLIGEQK